MSIAVVEITQEHLQEFTGEPKGPGSVLVRYLLIDLAAKKGPCFFLWWKGEQNLAGLQIGKYAIHHLDKERVFATSPFQKGSRTTEHEIGTHHLVMEKGGPDQDETRMLIILHPAK